MKFFNNSSITKKIVIVIITVLLLTFSIPKPVNAVGGVLMPPIVTLLTTVLDGIQHLLEMGMLGETNPIMKDKGDIGPGGYQLQEDGGYTVDVTNVSKYGTIDGSLWGWDDINIPVIKYTPEEIFANRVPALDVNFINPSVKTGSDQWDEDHNVAIKLRDTISSWYVALRTLALVGLLSVLVYLGIRMLLTSIAADRAKYKKMIMDWLVAICLLFALHYIMNFALTMSEVFTSLIYDAKGRSINVKYGEYSFSGNLMSFVRFMIQSKEHGLAYFLLYLMLIIYSIRFTWVYLKRVVNMAFLTIISPLVALTYPIDKVADGKAQAFDMWLKEYCYNALLQPVHLLLYIILLSSATELAVENPLYAIVCLGFILTAEKLIKSMFGFNKAGAGTVGSLAGAAAVSTLASQTLMGGAKKIMGGKGGQGKVRTNDNHQREGRDNGANKGYNSFDNSNNRGQDQLDSGNNRDSGSSNDVPPPRGGRNTSDTSEENNDNGENSSSPIDSWNYDSPETLSDLEQQRAELYNQGYTDDSEEIQALNQRIQNGDFAPEPIHEDEETEGDEPTHDVIRDLGPEPETIGSLFEEDKKKVVGNFKDMVTGVKQKGKNVIQFGRDKDYRKGIISEAKRKAGVRAYKTIRGAVHAMPTVAYKGVKGAVQLAAGAGLAATAGVIAATSGDGEKAIGAAGAAFAVGVGAGGNIFDSTVGEKTRMRDRTIKDSYGAGVYGNAIDARNAEIDKKYLKSQEHYDEYEKYFKEGKNKMSKRQYDEAVLAYRQAGITNKKDIRNALKLEQQYRNDGKNHGSDADIRGKVQNIVQTYDNINKRAIYGEDANATKAAIKNIESQLTNIRDPKQKRAVANEIMQGYIDWYNI